MSKLSNYKLIIPQKLIIVTLNRYVDKFFYIKPPDAKQVVLLFSYST